MGWDAEKKKGFRAYTLDAKLDHHELLLFLGEREEQHDYCQCSCYGIICVPKSIILKPIRAQKISSVRSTCKNDYLVVAKCCFQVITQICLMGNQLTDV